MSRGGRGSRADVPRDYKYRPKPSRARRSCRLLADGRCGWSVLHTSRARPCAARVADQPEQSDAGCYPRSGIFAEQTAAERHDIRSGLAPQMARNTQQEGTGGGKLTFDDGDVLAILVEPFPKIGWAQPRRRHEMANDCRRFVHAAETGVQH